ncbi:Ubiquitin-protein ligase [Ciborinia camelliae]|nr:Ubiquitin-protein ligase [Ciborinia camelliae]
MSENIEEYSRSSRFFSGRQSQENYIEHVAAQDPFTTHRSSRRTPAPLDSRRIRFHSENNLSSAPLGADQRFSFSDQRNEEHPMQNAEVQRNRTEFLNHLARNDRQPADQGLSFAEQRNEEHHTQNGENQGLLTVPFEAIRWESRARRPRFDFENPSTTISPRTSNMAQNSFQNATFGSESHLTANPVSENMTHTRYTFQRNEDERRQTEEARLGTSMSQADFQRNQAELGDRTRFNHRYHFAPDQYRLSSNMNLANHRRNEEQGTQTDEAQTYFMPQASFARNREELHARRVRFNPENLPTSNNQSTTTRHSTTPRLPAAPRPSNFPPPSEFRRMMHPVINDSQQNFSLSSADHVRPRRALSRTEQAMVSAEVNLMYSDLRNREVGHGATRSRMMAVFRARHPHRDFSLSERRNQHSNDIRLEVIKRMLVPASAQDDESCPICQEEYTTTVGAAAATDNEVHKCPHCQEQYVTTPNNPDAHDPCTMPVCTHVFGRGCITQWLKDKNTCPMCRAKVRLP